MEILVPFGFDSTITPTYDMGYGTVGYTAFKKTDEKRIKEQLALINWLSAPFGTTEYLQKNFGTEGEDFTFDSQGNPIMTESLAAGNEFSVTFHDGMVEAKVQGEENKQ